MSVVIDSSNVLQVIWVASSGDSIMSHRPSLFVDLSANKTDTFWLQKTVYNDLEWSDLKERIVFFGGGLFLVFYFLFFYIKAL